MKGIGTMLKVLELCERYWNYVKGIGTMLKVLTIPKITLLQLIIQIVEKNISTPIFGRITKIVKIIT